MFFAFRTCHPLTGLFCCDRLSWPEPRPTNSAKGFSPPTLRLESSLSDHVLRFPCLAPTDHNKTKLSSRPASRVAARRWARDLLSWPEPRRTSQAKGFSPPTPPRLGVPLATTFFAFRARHPPITTNQNCHPGQRRASPRDAGQGTCFLGRRPGDKLCADRSPLSNPSPTTTASSHPHPRCV